MGIKFLVNIDDDQAKLLEDTIIEMRNIPRRNRNIYENQIVDHLFSNDANNNLIIVRGVHYNYYDRYGQYHFNVQIQDKGMILPSIYHVYVEPTLSLTDNGLSVDVDGTVTAGCYQHWIYQYRFVSLV